MVILQTMDAVVKEGESNGTESDLLDTSEKEHCRSSTPSNMDSLTDFKGIEDEEFDFNLPLTDKSASYEEDEEEVFFGPQKFHEKVVAAAVKHLEYEIHPEMVESPSAIDFDQIAKDAQLMVDQFQEMKLNSSPCKSSKSKKTISYPVRKHLFSPRGISALTSKRTTVRTSPKSPLTTANDKHDNKVTSPAIISKPSPKVKKSIQLPRKHKFALDIEAIEKSPVVQTPEKSLESLPKGKVEQTESGVTTFSAKTVSKSDDKLKKPVQRRSLQQAGSKLRAPGKGIARSSSLRGPRPPEIKAKELPLMKKPRCGYSSDDTSETMSVCSDVSDSSVQSLHLPNGKRRLPAPKLKLVKPGLQKPSVGAQKAGSNKKAGPASSNAVHQPVIKAPSRGGLSAASKGAPLSKLSLMKPALGNRRSPSATSKAAQDKLKTPSVASTKKTGPLRALHPAPSTQKSLQGRQSAARRSIPSALSTQKEKAVPVVSKAKPSRLECTPVKAEKKVQPKKILTQLHSPTKNSDSGASLGSVSTPQSSVKRRSMLPTPTRSRLTSLNSSFSSRRTGSSVSSEASLISVASPLISNALKDTSNVLKPGPPVGLLVDVAGSPSGFKSKKPGVLHTPQLRENSAQRSIWSPVNRPKSCDLEDAFLCTKRTNVK